MRTIKPALLILGSMLVSSQAMAEGWMVRVRAVDLMMEKKSDANAGAGLAANAVTLNSKWAPEVDFSYFFTKNIAAELILTVPQKHDVSINGGKIGSVKHLPPTLTLQYHFTPDATFSPYVGVGVNYTRYSGVDLGGLQVEKSSTGLAVQIGADIAVAKNTYLNVDAKKIQIGTDVTSGGTKVTHLTLDPWVVGIGIGWKF